MGFVLFGTSAPRSHEGVMKVVFTFWQYRLVNHNGNFAHIFLFFFFNTKKYEIPSLGVSFQVCDPPLVCDHTTLLFSDPRFQSAHSSFHIFKFFTCKSTVFFLRPAICSVRSSILLFITLDRMATASVSSALECVAFFGVGDWLGDTGKGGNSSISSFTIGRENEVAV